MKLFDLTHPFDGDMPVYPGDPKLVLVQTDTLEDQGFNGYCLTGGMHVTGWSHRFRNSVLAVGLSIIET